MKKNNQERKYSEKEVFKPKEVYSSEQQKSEQAEAGKKKKRTKKPKTKKQKFWSIFLDVVIVLLIVVGLYLLLKPIYVAYKQDQITAEINSLMANNEFSSKKAETTTAPSSIDGTSKDDTGIWVDANANAVEGEALEDFGQEDADATTSPYYHLKPIGNLQIDRLGLNLPIFEGAGYVPLRYGAGWYEASAPIGEQGRASILAHTYYDIINANERGFTRLKDVQINDPIRVVRGNKIYKYVTTETKIIPQEELYDYLTNTDVSSELMLVTCYNKPSWDQRYLLFAKLVDVVDK